MNEDRSRVHKMPSQVEERIFQHLSPCDDGLPLAEAIENHEHMAEWIAGAKKNKKAKRDRH